jgi:hypothetical protein
LESRHVFNKQEQIERILWSIAFPGLGQLLNKKYIKGLLFVFLEFLINVNGNFNQIIILSFYGRTQEAIQQTGYRWLMFYPCIYMFAMWDAYRDSPGEKAPFSYIPYVLSAFAVTVAVIYSSTFKVFGILPGPVWLSIIVCILSIGVGLFVQKLLRRLITDHSLDSPKK